MPTTNASQQHIDRLAILRTEIPFRVVSRIRGKSRCAVRNVSDLSFYMKLAQSLLELHSSRVDREMAVCELLGVKVDRFREWHRIWKMATKRGFPIDDEIFVARYGSLPVRKFYTALKNDNLESLLH